MGGRFVLHGFDFPVSGIQVPDHIPHELFRHHDLRFHDGIVEYLLVDPVTDGFMQPVPGLVLTFFLQNPIILGKKLDFAAYGIDVKFQTEALTLLDQVLAQNPEAYDLQLDKANVLAALGRNQELDITGLLLHREGSFFQVLEGEEDAVRQVFDKIQRDPRHERIKVLFEGPIEAREFADWRMGFVDLNGVDVKNLPGFSDFLSDDVEPRRAFRDARMAWFERHFDAGGL